MNCSEVLLQRIHCAFGCNDTIIPTQCVDWRQVYDLALKHGIISIVCDGLESTWNDLGIDEDLWYSWLGQTMLLEQERERHLQVLRTYAKRCKECGIDVFVLKGLAFGTNWPKPEQRPCGDIDIILLKGEDSKVNISRNAYDVGNVVAEEMGAKVDTHWYKHSQFHLDGVMFENHEYLVCTREGKRLKELNDRLVQLLKESPRNRRLFDTGALIPSAQFNALFQAYHSLSHFVSEGISLRYVMDWATFLQKEQDNVDWSSFYKDCERYHLKRFVDAITDISVHRLGAKVMNPQIVIHSPYTGKVLDSILHDDAKVFGTQGSAWNHRWRLVKNTFKYRWKYREIYQISPLCHLWSWAIGYIFHTED